MNILTLQQGQLIELQPLNRIDPQQIDVIHKYFCIWIRMLIKHKDIRFNNQKSYFCQNRHLSALSEIRDEVDIFDCFFLDLVFLLWQPIAHLAHYLCSFRNHYCCSRWGLFVLWHWASHLSLSEPGQRFSVGSLSHFYTAQPCYNTVACHSGRFSMFGPRR